MATNNRLVDYNRSLMTTDTAFQTFLSNIQASSNSYSLDALKECHTKLPIEWRNSEEIYLAGAWSVGNILGYNDAGNIILMPFNRSSLGWANRGFDMYEIPVDVPICDNFYYNKSYGIIIENTRSSVLASTGLRGDWVGVSVQFPANEKRINWGAITEQSVSSSHFFSLYGTTASNNSYFDKISFGLDVTDFSSADRLLKIHPFGPKSPECTITYDPIAQNFSTYNCIYESQKVIINDRKIIYLTCKSFISYNVLSTRLTFIERNGNEVFVGNANNKVRIGWLNLYNQSWIKSQLTPGNVTLKDEDVLTINLSQPSDIFIHTSKGAFVFTNQPAGTFDYKSHGIIDCKVYAIAIKFL